MRDVVYCPICNNAFADSEVEYIQVGAETRDNPADASADAPFAEQQTKDLKKGLSANTVMRCILTFSSQR